MFKKLNIKSLSLMLTISLMVMISGCTKDKETNAKVEEDYTPVETMIVEKTSIGNTRKFDGTVMANEEVMVMPKIPGTVEVLNVELGDKVNKGDILFKIDQKDVSNVAKQANVSIELARKGVEQAQNSMETANTNYELTKEKFEKAKMDLERTRELYEEGAVSKSQLEQAELAASPNQLELSKKQVNQSEIAIKQAKEQLSQAQLAYEQAINNVDNTVVTAPISGVISELNVKLGQIASNAQAAANIVDIDKVYLQINLTEDLVNKISLGQSVEVEIPAAFEGTRTSTISYISSTADIGNKLYSVKIYTDNEDKKIRPGMNGEVKLDTDKIDSVIAIDKDAILDEDGEEIVYVVEEGLPIRKIVNPGFDNGTFVEIKSGLTLGEELITKGQHYVKEGKKVKVIRGE